ncbi:MAG: MMPL family transporter [Acidimicrobiales bacterium]
MLRSLASWSFRHRYLALVAWLAVAFGTFAAGAAFAGPISGGSIDQSDAGQAYTLLQDGFGTTGDATAQIVVHDPTGIAPHLPAVEAAADALRRQNGIVAVTTGTDSPDGTTTLVSVDMATTGADDNPTDAALDAVRHARTAIAADGAQAELAGWWFSDGTMPASELYGIAAAAIILLVAFGSVVAMGVPLLTALLGLAGTIGLVGLWANVLPTPDFATQMAAMIGLGVGIDYALLIVTRYRRELAAGHTHHDAVVEAMGTAGRAVVLAGATVVVSLLGMLLIGLDILQGAGVTAASAVVVAVAAAVTLLPAVLALVGRHIDALSVHRRRTRTRRHARALATPPATHLGAPGATGGALRNEIAANNGTGEATSGVWYRWSRSVQRHPAMAAAAGVVVLATLAAPVTALRLASSDAGNDPAGTTTRSAYDLIAEHYGPGVNGPLIVAIPPTGNQAAVDDLIDAATNLDGVAAVAGQATAPNGTTALTLIPATGPQDAATTDLVHRLRHDVIPASGLDAHVGGTTALDVDFADIMASRLPWFMGAVLAASFLLLMIEFRSLLVPLKAVILNLASIGAAYGVLVAVFQWGWFGLATPGPIEPWAPMLLFAIVFGLSMDYEVFLLTAVKERFDRTGEASGSVADGLAATARVITAAAAIMVCVFGSFVVSDLRPLRLFGFGTAAAVLIDATIVRLVLVPATMELLGSRNWWAPHWLHRILPGRAHTYGAPATTPSAVAAPADPAAPYAEAGRR